MQRQLAEIRRKNEEEINALRAENQRIRRQTERTVRRREMPQEEEVQEETSDQEESRAQTNPNQIGARAGTPRRHPFVDGIMTVDLPARWKGLTMNQYDGTTDPEEHIDIFTTQVGLYTTEDAILCHVFPTSLKGPALRWFTRLPPNFVDCFDTLTTRFSIQFATSKPHHLTSLALLNVRQAKDETLCNFMERFGKLSLNISNLNPEVAMHHLITALRLGPFVDNLCKKPVANLDELRMRATKFMQMEELKEFRNTTRRETLDRKQPEKDRATTCRPGSRFREQRQPKYHRYTPLISNRARILEEALNADLISMSHYLCPLSNSPKYSYFVFHTIPTSLTLTLQLNNSCSLPIISAPQSQLKVYNIPSILSLSQHLSSHIIFLPLTIQKHPHIHPSNSTAFGHTDVEMG